MKQNLPTKFIPNVFQIFPQRHKNIGLNSWINNKLVHGNQNWNKWKPNLFFTVFQIGCLVRRKSKIPGENCKAMQLELWRVKTEETKANKKAMECFQIGCLVRAPCNPSSTSKLWTMKDKHVAEPSTNLL